jgi:glycosyltransferase involved in cell wall biosynthesis
MKVVLLSHSPDDADGGASRIYHLLTDGLRARGHRVHTLHYEDLNPPSNPLRRLAVQRFALPWLLSRAGKRLDLSTTDVVMSSSGMAGPLFRRLREGGGRRPLLVNHLHGLAGADHAANLLEAALGHRPVSLQYRLVTGPLPARWDAVGVREADVTVVQNLRDLGELRQVRPIGRIELIPPGLHPELMAASQDLPPLQERDPARVLWFASWEARKGAAYVPGAFRLLRAVHPQATMVLGGTGRSPAELTALFAPEDRGALTVLPRITRSEHIELLRSCSIFLFPSLSEGFGLALVEAMAFGLAAVTTNTAFGGDHLTDGINARVVPPTTEHIARALRALVEDPGLRYGLALQGREIARQFDLKRMLDSYEDLFRSSAFIGSSQLRV